eukprot:358148_1
MIDETNSNDAIISSKNNNLHTMFDSIEIQPARNNFGTITKHTRPTVSDLSMGNLAKHFESNPSQSAKDKPMSDAMLEDQELNENDQALQDNKKNKKQKQKKAPKKFGTFDGVLARCLLCIWGVIMYLRTVRIFGN